MTGWIVFEFVSAGCGCCAPQTWYRPFVIAGLQAFHIYLKFESYPDALMVALRAGNRELQERAFGNCADFLVKQQLCHILARQVW